MASTKLMKHSRSRLNVLEPGSIYFSRPRGQMDHCGTSRAIRIVLVLGTNYASVLWSLTCFVIKIGGDY